MLFLRPHFYGDLFGSEPGGAPVLCVRGVVAIDRSITPVVRFFSFETMRVLRVATVPQTTVVQPGGGLWQNNLFVYNRPVKWQGKIVY
jgi:hypothetical protein